MDNAKELRNDMPSSITNCVISADLPDFEHYHHLDNEALWLEVQKNYPTGYKLSHAFLFLPVALISRTGKLIAASIANKVNPSHTGVCYASRKTLALDAEVSIATLDRFTAGATGRAIFTSEIPQDKIGIETARRTLTRGAMLFCLAIALFRKTTSRVKQKVMAFALKAASVVLFTKSGGRKTQPEEGAQNASQKKILTPSKSQKEKTNTVTGESDSVDKQEGVKGKTLQQWNERINKTRIQGQLNTAERNYQERQSALGTNEKRYKHMFIKLMDTLKKSIHQRDDGIFRSSFNDVDYSKKPDGFR